MHNENFWSPVLISVEVTLTASILAFAIALAASWAMARTSFRGKVLVETLLMLPLVLPPTVVGFGLLVLLGRNSWLGRLIEWLFHQPVIFTWWAAVIAATVVAFPLVYQTLKTGFESVDRDLEDVARTEGASEWQVFRHITLPLAWRFLLSAYLFGFARGIGEFGATLMFAGNIPGKTETIPTAIYLAVESGNMETATYWVLTIVVMSYAMLGLVHLLRSRHY
ncbi:molybdate ABC transporter permease subunit [Brevibacillus sp. H7]|uniref:molybdate ABC transporter permease subunit n=1 Tax=Brevibacillus sp. H7 TaxID=3349138 RepID=UPI00381A8E0C